jgi:ubiquinone/menaquinone biosynthesis C-methylase UbiE
MIKDSVSPVKRTKAQARANYNRLSRWYDWLAGSSEAKYRRMGEQTLHLQPGERLLEIGFGTGQALVSLAEAVGAHGRVCGLDLSDGMAAVARQRLSQADLTERTDLTLGDAAQAPFAEASFDAVFMSFTLELFDTPEILIVLHQCMRMLRPLGRLVIVTLVKTQKPNFAERIYEWFHERMPVAVDCRPIPAQTTIQAAGFEITAVTAKKMWGLPVEIITAEKISQ